MKIGLFTVLYQDLTFEGVLDKLASLNVEAVELGTGNMPGNAHCNIDVLLESKEKREDFLGKLEEKNITISGLSCQGNPLHPEPTIAKEHHDTWRKTVLLAEKLGVNVVNCFSGCPGDHKDAKHPNWITCSWPPE
ncbi:sugar phosphate isomerase/epimerase [Salicibibacter halophilus]|uniref:Sugar phosphate isomerase/epimerase n=1 Tax=Salicibibacter halophilus TaxID=2502791 RepID=A0A514LK69_9BACI|nr:sugar phosphate isomerase/epimerase [Salicibibacter halophilus]QDI91935.1 sugar phosphate isomerase/epimerase [Salicibibacter halophilus]